MTLAMLILLRAMMVATRASTPGRSATVSLT
jgi:hypothetical protein